MSKWIGFVLLAGTAGFVGYCAAAGITVNDCCAWIERQTGVRLKNPDVKSMPYPAYSPVVVPGK
jgi:hypothetical protein